MEVRWAINFAKETSDQFMQCHVRDCVACHRRIDRSLCDGMNQDLASIETNYYFVLSAGDRLLGPGIETLRSP
jgi:hypothetical protein